MSFLSLVFMMPLAVIRLSLWLGAWTFVTFGLRCVDLGMWFSHKYDGLSPWLKRTVGEKSPES